jgi:hypothetical protein
MIRRFPFILLILVLYRAAAPAFADPKQDFIQALSGQMPAFPGAAAMPPAVSSAAPAVAGYADVLRPPPPPDNSLVSSVSLLPPPAAAGLFTQKHIMGKGASGVRALSAFLLDVNGEADADFVRELAASYVEEAETEGVNHDIAFAQMCLETGYLRYGGLVTAGMNNFCGLGSIGPGEPGEHFPTARLGVRAHIQHLKAYASTEPVKQELVDPRTRWVRKGSAPVIKNLAGAWAADRQYADKIGYILARLYEFSR